MIRSVLYVVFLLNSVVVTEVNGNYFYPGELDLTSKILKQNEGNQDDYFFAITACFIASNNLPQTTRNSTFTQFEEINLKSFLIRAPPVQLSVKISSKNPRINDNWFS